MTEGSFRVYAGVSQTPRFLRFDYAHQRERRHQRVQELRVCLPSLPVGSGDDIGHYQAHGSRSGNRDPDYGAARYRRVLCRKYNLVYGAEMSDRHTVMTGSRGGGRRRGLALRRSGSYGGNQGRKCARHAR
jgi:hypothetical protein